MMQFRMVEARLDGMIKHREFVANRIAEIEGTVASIDEISKAKGEVMFHVGGEAFMQARPSEGGKVLVTIGADVALEKTVEEAKKLLQSRRKEAEDAMGDIQKEIENLTRTLEGMMPEMEALNGR